jgi:hypothetical protein
VRPATAATSAHKKLKKNINCAYKKRQYGVGYSGQAVVEKAGKAGEQLVAEDKVDVFHEGDGVGYNGGQNVGGTDEIRGVKRRNRGAKGEWMQ